MLWTKLQRDTGVRLKRAAVGVHQDDASLLMLHLSST